MGDNDRNGISCSHFHLADKTVLYGKQQARVRVAGGLLNEFRVKKGVRQRCVISPYLFNIMAEVMMREVMDGWEGQGA